MSADTKDARDILPEACIIDPFPLGPDRAVAGGGLHQGWVGTTFLPAPPPVEFFKTEKAYVRLDQIVFLLVKKDGTGALYTTHPGLVIDIPKDDLANLQTYLDRRSAK